MSKTRASCFIRGYKHLETIKVLRLPHRTFISFSTFVTPDEALALVFDIFLQTGQNAPRECTKRWNVTTKRGIHTVYIFATIKVKCSIQLISFAVKSTAAGSRCLFFFPVLLWLKLPSARTTDSSGSTNPKSSASSGEFRGRYVFCFSNWSQFHYLARYASLIKC